MEFGERLAALREQKGLTQAQIAEEIGISRRMYVAYENEGKRPRKLDTYNKLAESLGCDVNDLLVEDVSEKPHASVTMLKRGFPRSSASTFAATSATGSPLLPVGIASLPVPVALTKAFADSYEEAKSLPSGARPVTQRAEMEQERIRNHKQFTATAKGLIFEELARQGVPFAPLLQSREETEAVPESIISLGNGRIRSWWLFFVERLRTASGQRLDADACASILLTSIFESKPDDSRKTSFVVEDADLFAALVRKKERNAYRGNLSVILVDADNVSLAREVFIATYHNGDDTSGLVRVAEDVRQDEPVLA